MKINLSIRMKMNAALVPEGSRVADIGCDHGYVAMWLADHKSCPVVIATDKNEGPVRRAKKNMKDAGYDGCVDVRMGDGLSVINPGEADTVLIAGMGGMLICEILSASPDVLQTVDTLILQPQSDVEEVRRHIHSLGYYIDKESICMEEGKYYFSIRAKKGEEDVPYTSTEYRFSRLLAEEGGTVFRRYMREKTDKLRDILNSINTISAISKDTELRKQELQRELEELRCRL